MTTSAHYVDRNDLKNRVLAAYDWEIGRLDAHDVLGWSRWLDPDFTYEVPIPVVREGYTQPQFSGTGYLALENRHSVDLWIKRLSDSIVEFAYAENPPARYRHFLSGIQVTPQADAPEFLDVRCNVMVTWARAGNPAVIMTGERNDVLAIRDDEISLRSRRVLLDSEVVHFSHLKLIF